MIESLARLGYASKAFVYCTVGLLGLAAAFNRGGEVTDTRGALQVILSHPFGNSVLFLLAAGLCGYCLWRVLDAIFDPERKGTDAKGLASRIASVVRAFIYGGLGLEALRLARGLRSSGEGDAQMRSLTAEAMSLPLGGLLVAAVGIIAAVYGASEIIAALRAKPDPHRDLHELGGSTRRLLQRVSRFGVAVRALIIVALGILLVRAAIRDDPGEAEGLRGSVLQLADAGPATWILAFISVGLVAYAVDQALNAKYRRIRPLA